MKLKIAVLPGERKKRCGQKPAQERPLNCTVPAMSGKKPLGLRTEFGK